MELRECHVNHFEYNHPFFFGEEVLTMKTFSDGLKEGMQLFGQGIATLVNTLLLTFVYVIGVGITALIAKLFRKQFLQLKLTQQDSYWTPLDLKKKPKEEYYRQF